MITMRRLCALLALLTMCDLASAKGGVMHAEDRYNPQHIDSLPPEIRRAILEKCPAPKALHDFAHYAENPRRIVLHFEYLLCDGEHTFCGRAGCLHEVYDFAKGRYRLVRSYYAPPGD